jgi:hypothetical protein
MGRFKRLLCSVLLVVPDSAISFEIVPLTPCIAANSRVRAYSATALRSSKGGSEEEEGLILNGLDQEMRQMSSKYSFSEIDFLAAAKKRAQERPESRNASAGEADWKELAEEKKSQFGVIDDWENSMKEAGNVDSQILMFTEPTSEDGNDGDDEPKLLLF